LALLGSDEACGEEFLHEEAEEKVDDENSEGGVDHRLGRATSDTYRTVGGLEPLVAGDENDEDAKAKPLGDRNDDIIKIGEELDMIIPIGRLDLEDIDPYEIRGEDGEAAGLCNEQGDRDEDSDEARGDEVVNGVDAHRAEGVNLLGDLHGADFRSHGGADAASKHEGGDGRAEFSKHGATDEATANGLHIDELKLEEGLGGEDSPSEGASDDDDGLRAESDFR